MRLRALFTTRLFKTGFLLVSALAVVIVSHDRALSAGTSSSTVELSAWEGLRYADLRLARIIYRLAVGNNALCDQREAETGLVIQALDEYPPSLREQARTVFAGESPVVVEAVVPHSPADDAGIRANDGIEAINGMVFLTAVLSQKATTALRDRAIEQIRLAQPDRPIVLALMRQGRHFVVQVHPLSVCRISAELVMKGGTIAESDDKTIEIGVDQVGRWTDDDLAVLVAHEMAHVVLRHGDRLANAGVRHGLLSGFGANADLIRSMEDEADRYSVHLLANAGYDPAIAPQFWLHGAGRTIDPGILRSPTHGSPRQRAAIMQDEIAKMKAR